MDDPFYTYIILIILCLLFSAFFSGVEIAFISASNLKIELDKKQNRLSGKLLSRFIKKPSQFIGVMLLGNNLALVLYGVFMGELIMTMCFMVTTVMLVIEIDKETRRKI